MRIGCKCCKLHKILTADRRNVKFLKVMGKYSSGSDSEKRGSKSSYKSKNKRRSSSSSSSDSRSRRRKRKSRSRDRYSKTRRSRSRSSSSLAHKSKSRRRSRSKDRFRYKRSKSRSRDRHRRSRSHSKNRYRRSRSRSYIREYTSKCRRHSSSSSSSCEPRDTNPDDSVKNETIRKSPELSRVDVKTLNSINEDGFVPKQFSSSKSKKMMDNIVIDLKKQTIKVPEVEPVEPDSIFHHNLFLNEEARMEKWIKELYGYRQKALQQGLKNNEKM